MTAGAKQAPNREPPPTSSTPATAGKPRPPSSPSGVASHRTLPPAGSGRMARPKLFALFQTGSFALQGTQIVQLGAADAARADDVDVVHHLRMYREDTLHALAKTDLADGDALAHTHSVACNQHAFESLEALFLAFLDLHVHLNGVAGTKLGEFLLPLVLDDKLGQQRVLHDNVRNLLVYNMFRVDMKTNARGWRMSLRWANRVQTANFRQTAPESHVSPQFATSLHGRAADRLSVPSLLVLLAVCASAAVNPVTYHRQIEPTVLQDCAPCHRPRGAGPFSPLTHAQVQNRAAPLRN